LRIANKLGLFSGNPNTKKLGLSSGNLTGIFSFMLPVFLLALAFLVSGIHPLGGKSVLLIDSKLQYVSFFSEYIRQIRALEFPTFSRFFGPGMNFFGTWAYYLASPVNLLLLLFPKAYILDGMYTVLLVKAGLCGTAFYVYARRTLGSEQVKALLFSTSYALCGFVVSYSDNVQWLDGVIWLPILIMGIETVYRNGRCGYYSVIAAILIISNFYISVLTGVFCLLYCVYVVLRVRREDFPGSKRGFLLKIALQSLLGIGLAAFVLVPVYFIMRNQMSLFGQGGPQTPFTVNPFRTLGGLFVGRQDYVASSSFPKIYAGLLAVIIAPVYFLYEGIKKREKIVTALFLAVVFLCFHVSILNFVWNGLDFVGWFPFRYSFVFSFLLLTIAVKAINSPDAVLTKHLVFFRTYIIAVLLVCMTSFLLLWSTMNAAPLVTMIAVNFVLIVSFYYLLGKKPRGMSLLLLLVCLELFMNAVIVTATLNSEAKYADYNTWTASYNIVEKAIEENNLREKQGRTAILLGTISGNDPLLFGLGGIDYYSSAGNTLLSDTLYKLGYQRYISNGFEISDNGGSQLLNSLMGVSSTIMETSDLGPNGIPATVYPVRHILREDNLKGLEVINNPLALSTAYLVNRDVLSFTLKDSADDPFALTDRLLSSMLGKECTTYSAVPFTSDYANADILDKSPDYVLYTAQDPQESSSVTISFSGNGEAIPLYLNMSYSAVDRTQDAADLSVTILTDGKEQQIKYPDVSEWPSVLSLGSFPKGQPVTVEVRYSGQDLYIWYLRVISQDPKDIENALAPLLESQGDMQWTTSGTMRIEENAKADGVLFVSIPYDAGWRATVNGKPIEVLRAADAFIGIELEPGENVIEMSFFPEGLAWGLGISLASLAAAVIQIIVMKKRKRDS